MELPPEEAISIPDLGPEGPPELKVRAPAGAFPMPPLRRQHPSPAAAETKVPHAATFVDVLRLWM